MILMEVHPCNHLFGTTIAMLAAVPTHRIDRGDAVRIDCMAGRLRAPGELLCGRGVPDEGRGLP